MTDPGDPYEPRCYLLSKDDTTSSRDSHIATNARAFPLSFVSLNPWLKETREDGPDWLYRAMTAVDRNSNKERPRVSTGTPSSCVSPTAPLDSFLRSSSRSRLWRLPPPRNFRRPSQYGQARVTWSTTALA
ncbi:uncharacterized protein J3R85_005208 [Psidium guajava]|nr:uncharacterized protein J3R85_005208 [Psidium guajava]